MALYRTGNYPIFIGNVYQEHLVAIAARCIERITGGRQKHAPKAFAVQMNRHGRVVVDRVADVVPDEWVMTCTRNTPLQDLVDELQAEVDCRRPRTMDQAAA